MSDSEYLIALPRIHANPAADEGLNDHRLQRERLPPPDDAMPPHAHHASLEVPRYRKNSRSMLVAEEDAKKKKPARNARLHVPEPPRLLRMRSNKLVFSSEVNADAHYSLRRERRPSRSSVDLEADSHASRTSQETEEDVCFPMEQVRINGIDFGEIEAFIEEERVTKANLRMEESQSTYPVQVIINDERSISGHHHCDGAKRSFLLRNLHAFRNMRGRRKEPDLEMQEPKPSSSLDEAFLDDELQDEKSSENVKFTCARFNNGAPALPDRFSLFHSDNEETIHSPDISGLVADGRSVSEVFHAGESTWWLDCTCPTDAEMKLLAKAFGIHPLTAEDIRMQETREKVELFRNYYFVCFHTFEPDKESEDYLEPINVYIVVFRDGVLTFHFSPVLHGANVRRRVRQLRDYVDVSADWIGYAMIDDITDGFAPVITAIEYEADAIEASVLDAQLINFSSMLRNIGDSRRKVMTLMRLLSNKADVIRMFAKRCQDEANHQLSHLASSRVNLNGFPQTPASQTASTSFGPPPGAPPGMMAQVQTQGNAHPRADIALYLGDIQDHVVTMFQNLAAYEKIFSRSHSNYLAQLQVESFNSNLMVTKILGNVTLLGTMFLPLNVITGLFGMNVHVPGEGKDYWFFGILGFMIVLVSVMFFSVKWWLKHTRKREDHLENSKKSLKSFSMKYRRRDIAKSILSFPNRYE
ncbi:cora-domain-containing protein [Metschnikowia bicuspidata]|uniref:Cora-domain-containing protein n=1 Tax=Metschnikowia bicuspidata TaxID=27322 RepID=A0A4V1J338_9ASCO|nr:cora-domain-containing protein [Metschnikowia bicuspidata]